MKKTLAYLATGGIIALTGCADRPEKAAAGVDPTEELTRIITDVRTTPVVTGIQTAEGGRPVIIFYTLSNTGPRPIDAAAMPVPVLFNGAGLAYQPDPMLEQIVGTAEGVQYDIKAAGQLNPGITTYGFTVFEVANSNWEAGGWSVGWPGQPPEDRVRIPRENR